MTDPLSGKSEARPQPLLVPHDPRWLRSFDVAAEDIRRLGNASWLIEHIGSTSIPGLAAKPIIDLAVRIQDSNDLEAHQAPLEAGGWRVGSGVRSHRVMLLEREGRRTQIAHFFEARNWEENNQRLLRDWLLGHPDDVAIYEMAKMAAAIGARDRGTSYNDAKTATIQSIIDRARAERGLPSVPVSDK